ncbi:hypothetical protein PR202_gb02084 [Eleusine coracana subsp. coracana]|uniref:Auxin-responsive protein n=1 Tax=Eleusine coracana subsp. coracana TaxID=191504 RepID=A0AAV5DZ83_ELECO|nr:hypothetical protein PR202_gb02084 [Eleusine coracana subsp. coracana]
MTPPLEARDYIGLGAAAGGGSSSCSSSSSSATAAGEAHLALRLGLPGSESPGRRAEAEDVDAVLTLGCPATAPLSRGGGAKRGFDDSQLDRSANRGADADAAAGLKGDEKGTGDAAASAPRAAKAQVVGWPPVRSYRKNTLAATANATKTKVEDEGRSETGCCYVKVSMDGAPYLRKVDLRTYSSYEDLSLGLEKMFSCFISGKNSPPKSSGDRLSDGCRVDALQDQEYVLTYEDKDADWMLVGDLPWE